jgi:hypothetical protein
VGGGRGRGGGAFSGALKICYAYMFNPNHHCFKTITKATPRGIKRTTSYFYHHPSTINKNVSYTSVIIKSTLKMIFLLYLLQGIFDFYEIFCIRLIFFQSKVDLLVHNQ